ncbi:putative F-box protein At3g10240 [Rutidosis leptorrhynchoides]|uniref:putative F-box protein At3g10240 n=1 Tax=Rutidosis leptorrhynchoides TaxID=125765 RepID=UPI003A9989F3
MANSLPIEIQAEIIKHLPIKSLIRCTLLSKLFSSIIKSSSFVTEHSVRHNQQHYLIAHLKKIISSLTLRIELITSPDTTVYARSKLYVSIIDNDTFPQNKSPITVPEFIKRFEPGQSYGFCSSQGLLCLFEDAVVEKKCIIWNPSIRRCIVIPIPDASATVVGFGVCPDSSDIKLVKIREYDNSATSNSVNWEAEVYTVSSGIWKTVRSDKPHESVSLNSDQVAINGIIYFSANDYSSRMNGYPKNLIITFDLTSDKIGEVQLPDSLALVSGVLYLSRRMESLAVIHDYEEGEQRVCDVWMMKHGVRNSYEKLFTFRAPKDSDDRVLGFRKNGDPILLRSGPSKGDKIEVYNPSSEQFTDLEVFGSGDCIEAVIVDSLAETLHLIDLSNTILINDDNKVDVDNEKDAANDNDDHDDDDDDATTAASVLMDMFQAK